MSAKDINDPSSIFYRWANSEVEFLPEEDIKSRISIYKRWEKFEIHPENFKSKKELWEYDRMRRASMDVIESNIVNLIADDKSLSLKENVDYGEETKREISYIREKILEKIIYLDTLYDHCKSEPKIDKSLEVANCYKDLLNDFFIKIKNKVELLDIYKNYLFDYAIKMSILSEKYKDLELEVFLFLAENNGLKAMHMAGVILAEKNEKAKAKELLEKASSLGFQPAKLSLESGILD